jgi:hypothetical protein
MKYVYSVFSRVPTGLKDNVISHDFSKSKLAYWQLTRVGNSFDMLIWTITVALLHLLPCTVLLLHRASCDIGPGVRYRIIKEVYMYINVLLRLVKTIGNPKKLLSCSCKPNLITYSNRLLEHRERYNCSRGSAFSHSLLFMYCPMVDCYTFSKHKTFWRSF